VSGIRSLRKLMARVQTRAMAGQSGPSATSAAAVRVLS
jgi:hypothetical protein